VLMQIILLEKKIYDTSLPLTKEDDWAVLIRGKTTWWFFLNRFILFCKNSWEPISGSFPALAVPHSVTNWCPVFGWETMRWKNIVWTKRYYVSLGKTTRSTFCKEFDHTFHLHFHNIFFSAKTIDCSTGLCQEYEIGEGRYAEKIIDVHHQ
jgi:hypothetical protein